MQLSIRGHKNYVLNFSGTESLQELRSQVAQIENSEDVRRFFYPIFV